MDHEYPTESSLPSEPPEKVASPDAAHFREAARLAASRVRAALAKSATREEDAAPVVEAEVFESAALQNLQARGEHDANPAYETIEELDERLQLGARMLRVIETQIKRLEKAALAGETLQRVENAMQSMETMLARVLEIEQSIATRMNDIEEHAATHPKHDPPVIEIEPLERTTHRGSSQTAAYGSLMVDPERLKRNQDRA